MKITRILAIAVIGAAVAVSLDMGAVQAQIREQQPAEFPPPSYKGKQYVDSQGCVFIRAGIDGNVAWIPRVTRARKTVCGFKPSIPGLVASAPTVAPAAKAPAEIKLSDTKPAAQKAATPAPRPVAKSRKAPVPVVVRQTAPKPAPRVIKKTAAVTTVPAAPKAGAATQRQVVKGQTACPGASPMAQKYLRSDGKTVIRCGPQSATIVGATGVIRGAPQGARAASLQNPAAPLATSEVTAYTRIVPRHVAYNRANTRGLAVPKGYEKAWDDGRLNPYRAEQNLTGRSQMLLIWTQTVPLRLIDTRTGRDVTASVPLIYPYIDTTTQSRELGQVTIVQRDGKIAKRVIRNPGSRKPVYSSRSASEINTTKSAAPETSSALAAKRYVQIGTFGKPSNARNSAKKVAQMGYPARIGKHRRGGKTFLTVQAGPFDDVGKLQSAIKRLRGAGYADAIVRK